MRFTFGTGSTKALRRLDMGHKRNHSRAEQQGLADKVDAMAKKPTPYVKPTNRVKAWGIPIGGSFEAIADAMGKMLVKPKRKLVGQTLNQEYASKNRKKWKGVST